MRQGFSGLHTYDPQPHHFSLVIPSGEAARNLLFAGSAGCSRLKSRFLPFGSE
jgi:hypothetical protein